MWFEVVNSLLVTFIVSEVFIQKTPLRRLWKVFVLLIVNNLLLRFSAVVWLDLNRLAEYFVHHGPSNNKESGLLSSNRDYEGPDSSFQNGNNRASSSATSLLDLFSGLNGWTISLLFLTASGFICTILSFLFPSFVRRIIPFSLQQSYLFNLHRLVSSPEKGLRAGLLSFLCVCGFFWVLIIWIPSLEPVRASIYQFVSFFFGLDDSNLDKGVHVKIMKVFFITIIFVISSYFDIRRLNSPANELGLEEFLLLCQKSLLKFVGIFFILALALATFFLLLAGLVDMLRLDHHWMDAPVYYGVIYGPFSSWYFALRSQFRAQSNSGYNSVYHGRKNSNVTTGPRSLLPL